MPTPKIMILEDDAITALELKDKLELWGYEVPALVSYGEEAIKNVRNVEIDLILADITLKGDIDGVDTVKKISETSQTPVLYITAHADDETFERAKLTNPYGYVLKPIDDLELKFNIEIALHKSGLDFDKENEAIKARIKAVNDLLLSSTPALSSNIHIEDTATFLNQFALSFEENVRPQLQNDLRVNGAESPSDDLQLFGDYLTWISNFFSNLGHGITSESDAGEFRVSKCIWGSQTADNKILCLMCRAMADLTFKWTGLNGWLEHEYKMGINPPLCRFKYVLV